MCNTYNSDNQLIIFNIKDDSILFDPQPKLSCIFSFECFDIVFKYSRIFNKDRQLLLDLLLNSTIKLFKLFLGRS